MKHFLLTLVAGALLVNGLSAVARAADRAAVDRSIARGAAYVKSRIGNLSEGGERSLAALALVKARVPTNSPEISGAVALVRGKVKDGKYQPGGHHVYEAGVDASFLVDVDAERYKPELEAIARYLISVQRSNGSWDYPTGRNTNGDISVTQYACLGLWSASRAGVEISPEVWQKVLRWLIDSQAADGGYQYVPGTREGWYKGETNLNMAVAAAGAILIAARELYPEVADQIYAGDLPQQKREEAKKPDAVGGVLERFDPSKVVPPEGLVTEDRSVPLQDVRRTLERLRGWIGARFRPVNDTPHFPFYYFYSVERMGALANITQIGQYDWYDACSTALVSAQKDDGSWTVAGQTVRQDPGLDSSFALLFLSRSTGKILKRTTPGEPPVGGGLLAGGKGAPTEAVAAAKEPTPLEELLRSLQNPGEMNLQEAQAQLVEQIQIGDRSELVGQTERLVELVKHPHGDVRRTAVWALGRTNDLSLASLLVDALEDPDFGVMIEAHAALTWLSRTFDRFGLPINPLDELPADASENDKTMAIETWRVKARRAWGEWYLGVRPYEDRGDEFEARLRQRLADKK